MNDQTNKHSLKGSNYKNDFHSAISIYSVKDFFSPKIICFPSSKPEQNLSVCMKRSYVAEKYH
jgi:hypothetical protein